MGRCRGGRGWQGSVPRVAGHWEACGWAGGRAAGEALIAEIHNGDDSLRRGGGPKCLSVH